MKPIAITMGDPRGIGPEIVAKLVSRSARGILVVGDADLLARTAKKLRLRHAKADVFHVAARDSDGGVAYVVAAHAMAMAGEVAAVVTGPIRKLAPLRASSP